MEEKILRIFSKYGGNYVSGEEISERLGVSRTSVWKHIEALRRLGYDIEASPHLGYKLVFRPDRLIPEELKDQLKATWLGKRIFSYESLDSTNDTAYKLAESGEKEGTVVIAERQTKGKGRQGRSWASPKGGVYLSCILKPDIEPTEVAKVTLVAAVAAAAALRNIADIPAMIKWPNDIIIGKKKVCGILTEMKAEQDKVDFLILGIGVNVDTPVSGLPKSATSIANESQSPVTKVAVAKQLLEALEHYLDVFKKEGFAKIRDEWRGLSATIGSHVKIHCHNEYIEGQAMDLDEQGGLILRLDSGLQQRILSGDVE